ncbi:MAG: polyprenyl synthetase family protein [Candidatus Dormibacteraeota bacterium]|nr:polyprenyl synthetase family protein [Candidatus Dormibacteraeota bacterium]
MAVRPVLAPTFPTSLTQRTREIDEALRATARPDGLLGRMTAYHLGWVEADGSAADHPAGKRIRPALVCWAAEACGGTLESALPAACAVELVHNFTLVHDDVQDRDQLRRGRPTVWSVWGEAQAINAGDAIAATALATLLGSAAGDPTERLRRSQAAAALLQAEIEVIEGQTLDLQHECRPDTPSQTYLRMVEAKTGALIGASLELGAIMAGAPAAAQEGLRRAGRLLGVAFQLRDDWLGVWGDPAVTGKSKENDLTRRKLTYPVVRAYEAADPQEREEFLALYRTRGPEEEPRIRRLLERLGGPELTAGSATDAAHRALREAGGGGLDETRMEELSDVARYLAERTS